VFDIAAQRRRVGNAQFIQIIEDGSSAPAEVDLGGVAPLILTSMG